MKNTWTRRGAVVLLAILGVGILTAATHAGENKTTKWRPEGFACILNDDGTSDCRFDVKAKNKLGHDDRFDCTVRVRFTTTTWKRDTVTKEIASGKWKSFKAVAHQVPAGEIVQKIRWRCGKADG
jgi:hypothetical protein